ncbi:hypothetical protein [Terrihabitans rhizophilus]|uniref:Uncharacterized protein n=1 Tax=Terrihabitans rhizophilus TaxID=3092662 RepID=A0ABU4RNC2_9HYPH|nr:hypothetical protein [Terrihabitans sp. PJ23]MDX6806346.1 hypothetical protein [Terrihabitans sp. PJ23]
MTSLYRKPGLVTIPDDPMMVEIEPGGRRVAELQTIEECEGAQLTLMAAISDIGSQIGLAEDRRQENAGRHEDLRWLRSAQRAQRIKKVALQAVQTRMAQIKRSLPGAGGMTAKLQAALVEINAEFGEAAVRRCFDRARAKNPDLWTGGEA